MKKLIPCLLIVCLLTGCSFLLPETGKGGKSQKVNAKLKCS